MDTVAYGESYKIAVLKRTEELSKNQNVMPTKHYKTIAMRRLEI